MDLARVTIVLVRPTRPANVAAACRAMKNMGLSRLRLVEPPPGLDDRDTRAPAYKAWDVLDGAEEVPTLAEAVADCTLVAGTTGRDDLEGVWSPRQLATEGRSASPPGTRSECGNCTAMYRSDRRQDRLRRKVRSLQCRECRPGTAGCG